jgi:cytoskeletal protein RodZ
MKFQLKSIFPSSLFNKITLKAAILVGLILFYLVIMLSSSKEGLETMPPQMDTEDEDVPASDMTTDSETDTPEESKASKASKAIDIPITTEEPTTSVENFESPSKTYAAF